VSNAQLVKFIRCVDHHVMLPAVILPAILTVKIVVLRAVLAPMASL